MQYASYLYVREQLRANNSERRESIAAATKLWSRVCLNYKNITILGSFKQNAFSTRADNNEAIFVENSTKQDQLLFKRIRNNIKNIHLL